MAKVLIIFYSRSGNTPKMASFIKDGVESEGVEVTLKDSG